MTCSMGWGGEWVRQCSVDRYPRRHWPSAQGSTKRRQEAKNDHQVPERTHCREPRSVALSDRQEQGATSYELLSFTVLQEGTCTCQEKSKRERVKSTPCRTAMPQPLLSSSLLDSFRHMPSVFLTCLGPGLQPRSQSCGIQ